MDGLIIVECNGILDKEIILSALQDYRAHLQLAGKAARANRVQSIITRLGFRRPGL